MNIKPPETGAFVLQKQPARAQAIARTAIFSFLHCKIQNMPYLCSPKKWVDACLLQADHSSGKQIAGWSSGSSLGS